MPGDFSVQKYNPKPFQFYKNMFLIYMYRKLRWIRLMAPAKKQTYAIRSIKANQSFYGTVSTVTSATPQL